MSTEGRRSEARRLQAAGMSVRQIAARMDLPPTTIQNWLPTEEEAGQFARWARLRAAGLSNTAIAEREGVNRQRVAAVLGPVPRRKTSGQRKPLDLSPATWNGARNAAAALGLKAVQGSAEGTGSVGMLLDALAAGELKIEWRDGYGPMQPLGVKA